MRGLEARLARASRVEIAGGTTTLDRVAIDVGGGTAVVSGTAGSALNLNATLTAVPASVANNFAPGLDAAGTISGTAKVTGAAANPAVGYSIDWRGAQTAQTRSAGLSPHERHLQRRLCRRQADVPGQCRATGPASA